MLAYDDEGLMAGIYVERLSHRVDEYLVFIVSIEIKWA